MDVIQACALLGVDIRTYTEEDVIRAFRRAALKHHPDKGGSEEAFRNLTEAVDILKEALSSTDTLTILMDFCSLAKNAATSHRVDGLCALVNVRTFCRTLRRFENEQRPFKLSIFGGVVSGQCETTGTILARGVGLSGSAVRFFGILARKLEGAPDVRCAFSQEGVNVFSFRHNVFIHFSAEDITFEF